MAVRLAAVLIQTPSPVAGGADLVDGVVGELIGSPGIDLTLVGAHEVWGESSTDRMTIESLPADAAVLDWGDADSIEAKLQAVDTIWSRSRHASDPDIPIAGKDRKKLYVFDLRRFQTSAEVVRALRTLLQSRQVKTVDVALGGIPLASPSNAAPSKLDPTGPARPPSPLSSRESSLDLDDLVDQLDELDP